MITKNDAAAGENRKRRGLWGLGLAALVAAIGLGVFGSGAAKGQLGGLTITPLAQGYSPDNNVILHLKGPSDVLTAELVFQPGGGTGWHSHPGPVVVVVKTGSLTEIHSNGCVTVHPAASVFFESAGEVHNAVNQTGVVTNVFATFLSPTGAAPLIPESDPGAVCQK